MSEFTKWFNNTSIKNIDLTTLTKEQFTLSLELAFNAGDMHGTNKIEEIIFNCPDCSEIKEDCVCLEPVLNKLDYEGRL